MLDNTFILKPFAQTAYSDAGSLPDTGVTVLQSGLNERPYFIHPRRHKFTTTFHGDAQSKHSTTPVGGIQRSEVVGKEDGEGREHLGWRKSCA